MYANHAGRCLSVRTCFLPRFASFSWLIYTRTYTHTHTIKNRGLPLIFSTILASFTAGAWRIFLMPIDTAKTVLQVEGKEGYRSLMRRIVRGEISALYQGAAATAIAAAAHGQRPHHTRTDGSSRSKSRRRGNDETSRAGKLAKQEA